MFLVGLLAFNFAAVPATTLNNGCVAFWPLSEASGTREDVALTNDLTDVNTVTTAGGGAHFTAANSERLTIADNGNFTFGAGFTAAFWVRHTTLAVQRAMMGKWLYATDGEFFIQTGNPIAGDLWIAIASTATDDLVSTGTIAAAAAGMVAGVWYRVAVVFDGTLVGNTERLKVYVNGTRVAVSMILNNVPATFRDGAGLFSLSSWGGSALNYFDGDLKKVGLWNRPLTPLEEHDLERGISHPFVIPRLGHTFELDFAGDDGWADVTGDVMLDSPGMALDVGMPASGPLDLVASTGAMKLSLNNSEENSAGLLGYYSPRHANCRPGFQLGMRARYTWRISETAALGKFVGRLRDIEPEPGRYRDRKTHCLAVDWMNEAAITKYNAPTQVNKRADEVLGTVVAFVTRQPESTSYDVADSTFPYALDNGLVEDATVLTEIQRIAQSEYGRVYVRGGDGYWGRLVFEKRTARLTPMPVAAFSGTMQKLEAASGSAKVKNRVKVTAHPRRVDVAATSVLFSKPSQNNPSVAPGAVLKISGRYVDPDNPNARVGGTDMVTPAATTDYLMNSIAGGGGSDLTANFTVAAVYGANQVDYTITNGGGTTGFVTKLQARGRGLKSYDPLEADEIDAASIALVGESNVALDMPYQSDFLVAKAVGEYIIDTWGDDGGPPEASIVFIPRTVAEFNMAMAIEPGTPISVYEELSVVNDIYYVQGVSLKISGDKYTFDFTLQRARAQNYWALGTVGRSELGINTVLAPL